MVVFFIAGWSVYNRSRPIDLAGQQNTSGITKLPTEVTIYPSDPVKGNQEAKVTIIEFGDFACTYCAQAAVTLNKVLSEQVGQYELIWKDFPLPSHTQAMMAAEAAQCAARQGKFWQYHDALWRRQVDLKEATLISIVGEVGIDLESFNRCLSSHETKPLIELNIAEGKALGVDGAPYFIINGQVIDGLITEDQLRAFLE